MSLASVGPIGPPLARLGLKNSYCSVCDCETYMKDMTTSGSMSPLRESKYFLRSWSQCSNTSVNFLSEWRTSWSLTMFLCFSSFKRHISLKAELGTPLIKTRQYLISEVQKNYTDCIFITSSSSSKRTLLSATISWDSLFLALNTVP